MLQCVAVCCSVLQCAVTKCDATVVFAMHQYVALCSNVCVAVWYRGLQRDVVNCSVLQCVAVCGCNA